MTDGFHPALKGYNELWAIGTGPSGRVTAALHKATGHRVAVKFYGPGLSADGALADDFRARARVWQDLDSARVVQLYEIVEVGGASAAVLELVDGPGLDKLLERPGAMTPAAALVVFDDVLAGLAAAHERGLPHGNLKPENVLFGRDGRAKITDFGVPAARREQAAPLTLRLGSSTPARSASAPIFMLPLPFSSGA
jgi:serine/threonine protein kinase